MRAARIFPAVPERWLSPFAFRRAEPSADEGHMSRSARAVLALSLQPLETRQAAATQDRSDYVRAWDWAIDQAIEAPDRVISNRLVTGLHHELGHELKRFIGADSGANFHAWSAWASDHIGALIRVDAVPVLPNLSFMPPVKSYINGRGKALSRGNREVLDDIGRVMVRLIDRFFEAATVDPEALEVFKRETLSPDQARLGPAITCYYKARFARTTRARQQLTYAGNLYTLEHEQHHLQSCIEEIMMPRALRPMLTRFMARISVGGRETEVSRDVDHFDISEGRMYPPTLETIEISELDGFVARWGRTPTVEGSGARNWADLGDRFNYLMHLCRVYHTSPALFEAPEPAPTPASTPSTNGSAPRPNPWSR